VAFRCSLCKWNLHIECINSKAKEPKHKHELVKVRDPYGPVQTGFACDVCNGSGTGFGFHCPVEGCEFDCHPACLTRFDTSKQISERKNKLKPVAYFQWNAPPGALEGVTMLSVSQTPLPEFKNSDRIVEELRGINVPAPIERLIASYVGCAGDLDLSSLPLEAFAERVAESLVTKDGETYVRLKLTLTSRFQAIAVAAYDTDQNLVVFDMHYTFRGRGHYYRVLELEKQGKKWVEPIITYYVYVPLAAKSFLLEFAPQKVG